MMTDPKIDNIIRAARLVLAGRATVDDDVGREAAGLLEKVVPAQTGHFGASNFPVTQHIGQALKHGNAKTRPLLDVLADSLVNLPWKYNYEPRDDMPELGQRMAWGEIIGPEAPLLSNDFCFGFTMIAPNSFYPAHFHPAIELYYVLSGTAEWMLEGKTTRHAPGTFVLHPSNAVHSMRTHDEPLLAMYTWSGSDIVTLSQYSD